VAAEGLEGDSVSSRLVGIHRKAPRTGGSYKIEDNSNCKCSFNYNFNCNCNVKRKPRTTRTNADERGDFTREKRRQPGELEMG
jgi:hypothetical protein